MSVAEAPEPHPGRAGRGFRGAGLAFLVAVVCACSCTFDRSGINDDATRGACLGHFCNCRDTDTCAPTCPFDQCQLTCERLDACEASCTDGCQSTCNNARAFDLTCGDGCAATCASSGECEITCGHRCVVTCESVGRCHVTMLDGEAHCGGTGTCQVDCLDAAGTLQPAATAADGSRYCLPGTT